MHSAARVMASGMAAFLVFAAHSTPGHAGTPGLPSGDQAAPAAEPVALSGPGEGSSGEIRVDEVLLVALGAWLGAEFGLPPMARLPSIERSSARRMTRLRYGASASHLADSPHVLALYDDEAGVIHLPARWTGRTPAEMSMLVHELVHHLQSLGGIAYDCPEAREALAYRAQGRWLELFGRDLETDFQIDGLTLLVRTNCLH